MCSIKTQFNIIIFKQFEVIFNKGTWCSIDSRWICNYFKVCVEEYFRVAKQYGAIIIYKADNKFILYDTVRFVNKKDIRKFIKEYLVHYITINILSR